MTGEVAEYEAARVLIQELAPARQAGYDALRNNGSGRAMLRIKGRYIHDTLNKGQKSSLIEGRQGLGSRTVVLLDDMFAATAIYETDRPDLQASLAVPGS